MNEQKPTRDQIRTDLIIAMVRAKVHLSDGDSEIEWAWNHVIEIGKKVPKKPKHLVLVSNHGTSESF